MSAQLRLFVIAGEPSGDLLGASLIAGLRKVTNGALNVEGIGGPDMSQQGLVSMFPMEELSVMGIAEVAPRALKILKRIDETVEAVVEMQPDALVTIDSPDFCLRVARRVRRKIPAMRIVHYVAPSVWAWRPGRAVKMAKSVDHVLALLPFEPPYMERAGMTCDFVGHPVAAQPVATDADVQSVRSELSLGLDQALLLLLPGSRGGEVERLAPVFAKVTRMLRDRNPDLAAIAIATPHLSERVRQLMPPDSSGWPRVVSPEASQDGGNWKRALFRAGSAAIAASGTVSLELASANTPMVIAYKTNWLTAAIVRRSIKIDTVTLVNLVTGTRAVREFLQQDCTPEKILPAIEDLLSNGQEAAVQRSTMSDAMLILGRGGERPGNRAAHSVINALKWEPC